MKHVMIDLETMGTAVNAPVLAIGACVFDPETGEIGAKFYGSIDLEDAVRYGRPSGATIKWWMSQSDEARKAITKGKHPAKFVTEKFVAFLSNLGVDYCVWGNGSSFDISILEVWIPRVLDQGAPWRFWNIRDCRTIKALVGGFVKFEGEREGEAHHALYDAIHQAQWVSHFWKAIRDGLATKQAVVDLIVERAKDEDLLG